MKTFFHPEQLLHHPRSYYSRGQMRTPQEVPERARNLLLAAQTLGFDIQQPTDYGMDPLLAVHGGDYLAFLQEAHQRWKEIPEDWGDEVMSNIFVREPNALRGILDQAARYLADGSCPIGELTWRSFRKPTNAGRKSPKTGATKSCPTSSYASPTPCAASWPRRHATWPMAVAPSVS